MPSYDPSVTSAATSTYVVGVTTGCSTPTTVGTTSVVGSSVRPIIGYGIVAVTCCSTTTEGAPCAPASAYLAEGTSAPVGGA